MIDSLRGRVCTLLPLAVLRPCYAVGQNLGFPIGLLSGNVDVVAGLVCRIFETGGLSRKGVVSIYRRVGVRLVKIAKDAWRGPHNVGGILTGWKRRIARDLDDLTVRALLNDLSRRVDLDPVIVPNGAVEQRKGSAWIELRRRNLRYA